MKIRPGKNAAVTRFADKRAKPAQSIWRIDYPQSGYDVLTPTSTEVKKGKEQPQCGVRDGH